MSKRTIESSATPHITVRECLGSLTARGTSDQQVVLMVQDGEDEINLEREGESVSFSTAADCTLVCPSGATLTVERVLGNLRVAAIEGRISAELIHGNATLWTVGPVSVGEILGNLTVHEAAGSLKVEEVKGNTKVHGVMGGLTLSEVGGNLVAERVAGGLEAGLGVGKVRGNVQLGPPFSPETTYRVNGNGNMIVRLPLDASLRVAIRARGNVRSDVPGMDLEGEEGEVRGSLGGGQTALEADVKGNVSLRPVEAADPFEAGADLEDLGAQIEWRVNEALARMTARLEESFGGLGAEAVTRRTERATEKARRKAERAAEQARMRAERAERRWQRASGRHPRPQQVVTDEERLRVLRMVEEGKITPEQASELLAALEG